MKKPAVYILSNRRNGTLYTGVTANLPARLHQHLSGKGSRFAARYECRLLVYFEYFDLIIDAIAREKQIKAGSREAKLKLIESVNPTWRDMSVDLLGS